MYFTLSFEIFDELTEKHIQFIKDCIDDENWVRPLKNSFVVECNRERDRKAIEQKLIKYAQENTGKLRFILSPLIDTGQITGFTSENVIQPLINITKTPFDALVLGQR